MRSTLGLGTILLENATVGVRCKLGVGAHLDTSAILAHDDILGDFNYLAPHVTVAGNVTIGHRCFLAHHPA